MRALSTFFPRRFLDLVLVSLRILAPLSDQALLHGKFSPISATVSSSAKKLGGLFRHSSEDMTRRAHFSCSLQDTSKACWPRRTSAETAGTITY